MFELGKEYTVAMAHAGGAASFTGILLRADLPLLCFEHGQGERIINVNSPAFISADREDGETAAALHERHEARRLENAPSTSGERVDIFAAFDAHKDDPPSNPDYPADR